jgi:hypothetical protein
MLPPFLGALLLLGTTGFLLLCCVLWLWARIRGDRRLARYAGAGGAGMLSLYGFFWVLGLLAARKTVLPPGESVTFCGFDCHLHVAVAGVKTGPELGVTVRFSSNAVQAPEFPRELQFRLLDASGREYAPVNQVPDSALRAGESWTHELHFPSAANPAGALLLVSWKPGLDYLVPGAGNPLVQRRRRLALPVAGSAGAAGAAAPVGRSGA